jgi:hypothetical protein
MEVKHIVKAEIIKTSISNPQNGVFKSIEYKTSKNDMR